MSNNSLVYTNEAVRVKVKKCEPNLPPEWRKFSVDPQITSLEVLYSLLVKAFDIKSDFSIKYKSFDPAGNEIYLTVLSDWDLDAAFLRIHNLSLQTASEPCLMLQIDTKPLTEVKDWVSDTLRSTAATIIASNSSGSTPIGTATRDLISPLQQSFGVSQKYVQQIQNKLPGLIMNHMEKTFSLVQKAFNMNEETVVALPPRPPLADDEFRTFLDVLGQIQRCDELRKVIFFGGIDPSLRRVVWKYILNVYPHVMNGNQRMEYMRRKSEQYYKLRDTWKTTIKLGYVAGELAYVTSMVKKDVLRTDRLHPFYAGSDDNQNIAALFNILTTYALNHPSVSYCQGMSDIASPLLVTMNDEAQAYICFCAIMGRLRGNFMLDGVAMTQKFSHLTEALSFYDTEFWDYLKAQQADDLLFCYRWLLLELKREFPFEDALRMLEVQWSSLNYETSGDREELQLFEKEFVPISAHSQETGAANCVSTESSILCGNDGTPISPYFLAKTRESAYTKVCAIRRQSSCASLNSLSTPLSTSANFVAIEECSKLNVSKRLNQSLDDNITRHATRRRCSPSSIIHQSLDETKMLQLLQDRSVNAGIYMTNDQVYLEDKGFDHSNYFTFHDTNPFKDDDDDMLLNMSQDKDIPHAFLSSSSSSLYADDSMSSSVTGCVLIGSFDTRSECNSPDGKSFQIPKHIAKLHNNNIINNIIARQLASSVGEGVKRESGSGGRHFRDLKEKIPATGRKGLSLEECHDKSQKKLIKNFNEFLDFVSINKSEVGNDEKISAKILSTDHQLTKSNKTKTPSQTHNQIFTAATLHPLLKLTKGQFALSLDLDSSSIPDTSNNTWSCSAPDTAIQQANNLSNIRLHLELNSQLSPLTHTPECKPVAEHQICRTLPISANKCEDQGDLSAMPAKTEDQDYYEITTNITRELRPESEGLDYQLFGDLISTKDSVGMVKSANSEIEYEKLVKDSLDRGEDLKESACTDISEILHRQRQLNKPVIDKTLQPKAIHLLNGQADSNLNVKRNDGNNKKLVLKHTNNTSKFNPFLGENLVLTDEILQATGEKLSHLNRYTDTCNLSMTPTQLPEVLMPLSSTATPDSTAIDEMATTAAEDEANFSKKISTSSSKLPPPSEFGGGNPFLMFLCLTLLLQHRNTIMKCNMDYNEIAMHFDKMVRKHNVTRVLNQARHMYIDYLKNQTTCSAQQNLQSISSISGQQQPTRDVNRNASSSKHKKHSKKSHNHQTSSLAQSPTTTSSSVYAKPSYV